MLVNILIFAFVSGFIAIAVFSHVLLIAAFRLGLFARRKPHVDAEENGRLNQAS